MSPDQTVVDEKPAVKAESVSREEHGMSLLAEADSAGFRTRWEDIQARFVDEPRGAVEKADGLVSEVMSRLTDSFARTRADLDAQWKRGDNVSTEDLRLALKRYRAFFARLLTM